MNGVSRNLALGASSVVVFLLVFVGVSVSASSSRAALLIVMGAVMAVLGLDAMMRKRIRLPSSTSPQPPVTMSQRLLQLLVTLPILLLAVDAKGALRTAGSGKFLLVGGILAFGILLTFNPLRSTTGASVPWRDRLFILFVLYMFAGSAYGRWHLGVPSTILSGAMPLLLAILPVRVLATRSLRSESFTRFILVALTVFVAADTVGMLAPDSIGAVSGAYGHEKSYLVVACVLGWYLRRNYSMVIATTLMASALFLNYSAATYVLALAGGAITLLLTARGTSGRTIGFAAGVSLPIAIGLAFAELQSAASFTRIYFHVTGKQNNDVFRLAVYQAAKQRIVDSPWFGSLFTDYTTVQSPFSLVMQSGHTRQPAHSDLLELWMLGGVVAVVALVWWLVATNIAAVRYCRRTPSRDETVLTRLLLMIVNGFFIVGLVNPILDQTGNALVLAGGILGLRAMLNREIARGRATDGRGKDRELRQEPPGSLLASRAG